jgi:MFS family permease
MSNSLRQFSQNTFSSLQVRNYRLYYIGQIISTSGTFMQSVAQAWLVLQLTNSGTALGVVTALQYLPVLFLSPIGGVLADRYPKRTLLYLTQSALGILALILGALVLTGLVQLWMVDVLAFCYGLVTTVDNPTRQSFVVEMVGEEHLRNAVTLYSSLVNLARVIGPAIAGFLIATIALAPCFIINGLSYAAVVIMLLAMRARELRAAPVIPRAKGQLREGFRYVASTPVVRDVLIMMALIGTFTFEFQVSLPLIAQFTFHGNAESYAALTSAMGLGAVVGGLMTAGHKNTSPQLLVLAALLFGLTTLLAAVMPNLILAVLAMVVVGFFSIYFTSLGNSILQLESAPQMRGRVMAFWAVAFLGSTTVGGPIVGSIGETVGPRWGLAVGGLAAVVAAALGLIRLGRVRSGRLAPAAVVSTAEPGADNPNSTQSARRSG